MHWADVVAAELAAVGDSHIVATGITPSGPIHVGNMREVLTADLIVRACQDRGLDAELVYVADDADPLRKVYPFLDSETYSEHVGKPLAQIPAPEGSGSYSEYFLKPFFESLDELGIRYRVVHAWDSYCAGKFSEAARIACDNRDEIKSILEKMTGRQMSQDWFPYNPQGSSGSMLGVKVTGYEWPYLQWTDASGASGRCDLRKGEGKLPWRLDWPARWQWIGVSCEPFGKDHASAGGSWDTAQPLVELFGGQRPHGVRYEWISLKGAGAMSSSAGNTVSAEELLDIVPPEIMRYLITRVKPGRAFDFDPGAGMISLADEYERLERRYVEELSQLEAPSEGSESTRQQRRAADDARRYELAQLSAGAGGAAVAVSFNHLAMLCQIKASADDLLAALQRSHAIDPENPGAALLDRTRRMRNWIASPFFPDGARIELVETIDSGWRTGLEPTELAFLSACHARFSELVEWDADTIQAAIPDICRQQELPIRNGFGLLYNALLGQDRGPRLGPLLSELPRAAILRLLSTISD
jgi:lysyl-tRNA synthetase class 1